MHRPLVSIITPVYNGATYIAETIESVLCQGYQSLEYIVVDDGSQDDSRGRLRTFGDAIRVIEQENAGEAAAVNRGFACANGEILAVINADDPVLPGLVDAAVAALAEHPDVAGVYPDWLKIDSTGKVLEVMRLPDYDYSLMLCRHLCLIGPGCFYRRSALSTELPRDPRYRFSGDLHQWLRMGARRPFLHIPQVLATWRSHENGTSQTQLNAGMAAEQVAVIRDLYADQGLPPTLAPLQDEALSAAYFSAAVLDLNNPEIPARRYMWESLRAKLIWNPPVIQGRHRNLRFVFFALGTPFTRYLASLYRRMRSKRFTAKEPGPTYAEWTAPKGAARTRE